MLKGVSCVSCNCRIMATASWIVEVEESQTSRLEEWRKRERSVIDLGLTQIRPQFVDF